ncbi:MAG: iron ABC transporter permease [Brevibacillus sp.]|nr:iron ABC transporter permease [Brevibacillus sp.]
MSCLLWRTSWKMTGLALSIAVLTLSFGASVLLGKTPIPFATAMGALVAYDESLNEHLIILTERFPRAVIGTVIGASLAVAGAVMQALTRNPLASPSVFGINAGSLFFVVLAITFLSVSSLVHLMWFAFLGAAISSALVYALGSMGKDGLTPVKIVLAGSAITALFLSLTQGFLVMNERGLHEVLFWMAGSVSGRTLDMLQPVLPYMVLAGLIALFMGKAINILITGEEIAKGLGQRTTLVKATLAVIIVLLAGGSVAVAGNIGFVGLITPHICRGLVGNDYRWLIPYSAVFGAILLLIADVAARFIIPPQEIPIGVMTAFIGTPFFIYLARRGGQPS